MQQGAKAAGAGLVIYGAYETIKYGGAVILAPETGAVSLVVAGVTL